MATKTKTLSGRQVLARMRRGDLPTLKGGYTCKSVFSDGAITNHDVMIRLFRSEQIEYPEKASIHCPWTLTESEDSDG